MRSFAEYSDAFEKCANMAPEHAQILVDLWLKIIGRQKIRRMICGETVTLHRNTVKQILHCIGYEAELTDRQYDATIPPGRWLKIERQLRDP